MKAKECVFYTACRRQQAQVPHLNDLNQPCHADAVGCNDFKDDMERRCTLFRTLGGISHARNPVVPGM